MELSRQLRVGSAALSLLMVSLPACKKGQEGELTEGYADLRTAEGATVGTARLTETDDGVRVVFEGSDLPPGTHGFHIHETGQCAAPSFESAGGHFNPTSEEHGLDNPQGHHLGDMPNLEVDANGTASFSYEVDGANLDRDGARSLIAGAGTALVIHENADDQVTDPAGDAGPRLACGVIKVR